MMKAIDIQKIVISSILTIMLIGCSSDFLEKPKPTNRIHSDIIFESKDGVENFISGILRLQRKTLINAEASGLHSIFFARSLKGNDLIQKPIWFSNDYDYKTLLNTDNRSIFNWRLPYKIIDQINNFIVGVEASKKISNEDKDGLLGQALALRGYYYFQLALEFGDAYSSNKNIDFPPIYVKPSLTPNPFSTKEQMFDRIITDLETAKNLLNDKRIDKSYINKSVAQAFLSQVYQYKGEWQLAKENAQQAYGGNPEIVLDAEEYKKGFNNMNVKEWLWALPQSANQTVNYNSHPHSMMDHINISHKGTFINTDFVKLFSDTDVRKLFYNHYKAPESDWKAIVTSKFTFNIEADIPIIRFPELILIEAEANYNLDDEANAIKLLDAIRLSRDVNATPTTASGQELLELILIERRKELYGECGVEWFDAKRLLRGIERTGNHRTKITVSPDDSRFELVIPLEELDAREINL